MSHKLGFNCTSCKTKVQIQVSEGMYDTKKMVRCSSCQEINTIRIPAEKVFLAKKKKSAPKVNQDQTFINEPSNDIGKLVFSVKEGEFSKAQSFVLSDERLLVGRKNNGGPNVKPDLEIISRDGFMSKLHCELKKVGDNYIISDFSSANGTWVNGEKLTKADSLFLAVGDKIKLGRTEIEITNK